MNRILLVLFTGLSLSCASSRPELVEGQSLAEQLDSYINDYYDQVVNLCIELHGKASLGQSPVNCGVRGNQMHLSFPSREYHDGPARFKTIRTMYQHWCAAAGSKFGRPGVWVRHFRADRVTQSLTCTKAVPQWPNLETGRP